MTQAEQRLDLVFDALADRTRRSILDRLRAGAITVTALARPYDMSLNAVSKHLKRLERAGLVEKDVRGRERYCRIRASPLTEALDWMGHYREFWTTRMDALETHLIEKRKRERKR